MKQEGSAGPGKSEGVTMQDLRDYCLKTFYIDGGDLRVLRRYHWKVEVGGIAGYIDSGYRAVRVMTKTYRAHHIVWLMVHVYLPDELDHIDFDTLNNSPFNLQEVSRQGNMNRKRGKCYRKLGNRFHVQMNSNRRRINKSFATESEAIDFVKEIYEQRQTT